MDAVQRWCEWHGQDDDAEWEKREVIHEAKRCGPIDVVLEIGSHAGASLRIWYEAFSPSLLIGVEHEDSARTRAGGYLGDGLDAAEALGAHIIYGSSQDAETWVAVKGLLSGREVDFLYIDGDHRYDAVKRDFGLYAQLVRSSGLIVLDDPITVGVMDTEVYRLVPELQIAYRTKLISASANPTHPAPPSGSLIVYAP